MKKTRIRFKDYILVALQFSKTPLPLKVKIFFLMDIWFMVIIKSALKNGKQYKNPRINQNYGYGAIHENVPKLRILRKIANPTRT